MPESPPAVPDHLPVELLDEYFAGVVSIAHVGTRAVDLLAEHCPDCRRELEGASIPAAEAFARGERLGRARVAEIEAEEAGLRHVLALLLSLGPTETLVRVAADPRCHTVAFVEHQLAVAWQAFEERARSVSDLAWTLALVALRGLDVGRYGRPAVAALEAELWLLEARDSIARGEPDVTRAAFRSAGKLLREAGRPAELGGLELLAAAELALAEGRLTRARRVALAALDLLRQSGCERWRFALERLIARIDRLEGRPRDGAERLLAVLGGGEALAGAEEWSLAREALSALLEAGSAEEAYGHFLLWWAEGEGAQPAAEAWAERGWQAVEEMEERGLVLGVLLRSLGRREEAAELLTAARTRSLRMGLGRDALVASLELLRLHREGGDEEALHRELEGIEDLAECDDVPEAAVAELARFAAAVWRGRLGDLRRVERALLARFDRDAGREPRDLP